MRSLFSFTAIAMAAMTVVLSLSLMSAKAHAWETDQYTDRNNVPADSLAVLNRLMNYRILSIVNSWKPEWGNDPKRFAEMVYSSAYPYDLWPNMKIPFPLSIYYGMEEFIEFSADIPRRLPSENEIYADAGWSSRGDWIEHIMPNRQGHARHGWYARIASTLNVGGVMLGTDKIGHFISEGYATYEQAIINGKGEAYATEWDACTENTFEGFWVSGVYSNADLTADFEGYRFYRSLSEDNVILGKPAIIKWVNSMPTMQRRFDWSDHVTDNWDEGRNPSLYLEKLQESVYPKLQKMCSEYWKNPSFWVPRDEEGLRRRYAGVIHYRPNLQNRMDYICGAKQLPHAFISASVPQTTSCLTKIIHY